MAWTWIFIALLAASFGAGPVLRRFSDRRLARKMRVDGRYMPWEEFERAAAEGQGTVVLNKSNMDGRLWWSPEDVQERDSATVMLSSGKLTVPPFLLVISEAALRRRYPAARIVVNRSTIRSHPLPPPSARPGS